MILSIPLGLGFRVYRVGDPPNIDPCISIIWADVALLGMGLL